MSGELGIWRAEQDRQDSAGVAGRRGAGGLACRRNYVYSEQLLYTFVAVFKNSFQLLADKELIGQGSQWAEAYFVVNNIGHFDAAGDGAEVMLVAPEAVGAAALLVDEVLAFADLGDFGYPVDAEPGEGVELIFY